MVRSVRPSRMSAGNSCKRAVSGTKGLPKGRRSTGGDSSTGANIVITGSMGTALGAEVSGRRSGKLYEIFDVCDRSATSNEHYRVRWKGFKDRKYDTYEPASKLRRLGFINALEEVDKYMEWKEKYMQEHPERRRAPNIYVYRKSKGSPIYTANESFTCVSMALNVMCCILKVNFLFNQNIMNKFHGNQGLCYAKLCKMVQHQKKILKTDFLSLKGMRHNKAKGCYNNTELILNKLLRELGVFLCGAKNGDGLYHVFVLEVRSTDIYIFDESLGLTNELVSVNALRWIIEWKFAVKGTKESFPRTQLKPNILIE